MSAKTVQASVNGSFSGHSQFYGTWSGVDQLDATFAPQIKFSTAPYLENHVLQNMQNHVLQIRR